MAALYPAALALCINMREPARPARHRPCRIRVRIVWSAAALAKLNLSNWTSRFAKCACRSVIVPPILSSCIICSERHQELKIEKRH
jgi:hypothetical protein